MCRLTQLAAPPREPPPSIWELPDPAGPDDLIAVGGDLEPGTILEGYRKGLFPMHLEDGRLGWWSPVRRGVIPVAEFRPSRSLRKSARRYSTTVDRALDEVIAGCADPSRPHGWITPEIRRAYVELGRLGWVHSVETWSEDGELVGGLYGVSIGRMFCGESMFHRSRDASKVALWALVRLLHRAGVPYIDVQWVTPHLRSLGAVEIGRERYLDLLAEALRGEPAIWWDDTGADAAT